MLELKGVEKSFSEDIEDNSLFSSIDLSIAKEDFYAILGPSGVGKSTLLSLMCGLDKPSKGQVLYKGLDLGQASQDELVNLRSQEFGFVFQSPYHLAYKNVLENILLPSIYSKKYSSKEAKERALYLADYVGILSLADRLPGSLSGGELQRMVFARALLMQPNIIFADEPTGSLDKANSLRILRLLSEQASAGCAVVMVTHDTEAAKHASKVLQLSKAVN